MILGLSFYAKKSVLGFLNKKIFKYILAKIIGNKIILRLSPHDMIINIILGAFDHIFMFGIFLVTI